MRAPFDCGFVHRTARTSAKSEQYAKQALEIIAKTVGPENVDLSLGYVGMIHSNFPINAVYQWSRGPEEAILYVDLKDHAQINIEQLKDTLRDKFAAELPGVRFSFEPADIINEVMSFGSPTPIEVSVSGPEFWREPAVCREDSRRTGQVAVPPRPAIRPVAGLSDDRSECRSREGGTRRPDAARCQQVARHRHIEQPLYACRITGPIRKRASPTRCRSRFRGPSFATSMAWIRSTRPTIWGRFRSSATAADKCSSATSPRSVPARCPANMTATT